MIDNEYLEQCLIKGILTSQDYAVLVTNIFHPDYFDNHIVTEIFKQVKKFLNENNKLPQQEIIINSVTKDKKDEVKDYFTKINSTEFNVAQNHDWLIEETNQYLKDVAIKHAIL